MKLLTRLGSGLTAALMMLTFAACSNADEKKYDIAPIFPLSSNKCEKYNGETEGTGPTVHCWVALADCKRAAADWAAAMKESGVDNAILFRCE